MSEFKALSLRIFPEQLKVDLKIMAAKKGVSLNSLIIKLLEIAVKVSKK